MGLDLKDKNRVTFNEITKNGVKNGMDAPRQIDIDLVDAQQARRILDRLIGYSFRRLFLKKSEEVFRQAVFSRSLSD